jgi:hypothetical protein
MAETSSHSGCGRGLTRTDWNLTDTLQQRPNICTVDVGISKNFQKIAMRYTFWIGQTFLEFFRNIIFRSIQTFYAKIGFHVQKTLKGLPDKRIFVVEVDPNGCKN